MAIQPTYNIWIRTIDNTLEMNPASTANPAFDPTLPAGKGLPRGLKRIGLITEYDSLEFKTRYNNVGGWVLKMRDDTPEATMLKQLCIGAPLDPTDQTSSGNGYGGITVTRSDLPANSSVIFSGPVRGFSATGDFYVQEGPTIEFYGTDDNVYFQDRIVVPPAPSKFVVNRFNWVTNPDGSPAITQNNFVNPGNNPYSQPVDPALGVYFSANQTESYVVVGAIPPGNPMPTRTQYINWGLQSILPGSDVPNQTPPYVKLNRGGQGYTYFNVNNPVRSTTSEDIAVFIEHSMGRFAVYPGTIPSRYIQPPFNVYNINSGVYRLPFRPQANVSYLYPTNFQARRIPFLFRGTYEDSAVLAFFRARFNNLLEKCQEIASMVPTPSSPNYRANYLGLTFNIREQERPLNNGVGTKTVLVYNIELVRSASETNLVFSQELGNLGAYKYSFDSPKFNYCVIGGQGQADLRWFFGKSAETTYPFTGNTITKYGLRESFKDRRDIQYGDATDQPNSLPVDRQYPTATSDAVNYTNYDNMRSELIGAMDSELRENTELVSLDVSIIDGEPFRYFRDYNVGNYCTVVIGRQPIIGQITDVTITLTKAEGEVVKATIGTQATGFEYKFMETISDNQNDLETLNIGQ